MALTNALGSLGAFALVLGDRALGEEVGSATRC